MLVLFTNRKSHKGFRSVPKAMTLSDLERPNGRHYVLFHTNTTAFGVNCVKFAEARRMLTTTEMYSSESHFSNILVMEDDARYLCGTRVTCYLTCPNQYTVSLLSVYISCRIEYILQPVG